MVKKRICVVTFPFEKAFVVPLMNIKKILDCNDVYYVVAGEKNDVLSADPRIYSIYNKPTKNLFLRIIKYVCIQIKISIILLKLSKNIDTCILFMEANTVIPIITSKILRKKILLVLPSSILKNREHIYMYILLTLFRNVNYFMANWIVLHSRNLIKDWNMQRYTKKILIGHEYFLDFDKFKIKKRFNQRKKLIGYVGRFSEEKGIMNFISAIPGIRAKYNTEFLIIGDGPLRDKVMEYVKEQETNDVKIVGWVSHDTLPDYLNELILLIIPSYTESGPIIALESMACGTPIVTTNVGHISSMIVDKNNGFIMENNSPICIEKNVLRALEYQDIDIVAKNAKEFVMKEFTFERAVTTYKKILERV